MTDIAAEPAHHTSAMAASMRFALWLGFAVLLILVSITAAISYGAVSIPASAVWSIIARRSLAAFGTILPKAQGWAELVPVTWSQGRESIVFDVRFPRAILAGLVGAGLATVGAVLQSATRNPLADPHLLGVSSGAALGAIIALLHTGLIIGLFTVPLFAFFGAVGATLLVMGLSRFTAAQSADRLVLCGVAVSFVISAIGSLAIFLGDPRAVHTVVFWMLGGFGLAQWQQLAYPALVLFAGFLWLMIRARELNALAMGDETAHTLGIPVKRFRMELFAITALITGVMVAFSGAIGFIGLMIPHLARMLVGSDNLRVLPFSALMGAIALIWADIAARKIVAPEDLPIGIVTGLVGGVAFLLVISRRTK
jgi:iron complex transport system permease protein